MHVLAGPFQRVFLDTRYKREYRFAQFLRDAGDSFFFFFFFYSTAALRRKLGFSGVSHELRGFRAIEVKTASL